MGGEFQGPKSDALVELMKWVNMIEKDTEMTVKTLMFDNACELVAGNMKKLCAACGIRIISMLPYSPSSNGIAERLVSVVTEETRAMLYDARLPLSFWAEAMSTFIYLQN
jgi:hypothetical protein